MTATAGAGRSGKVSGLLVGLVVFAPLVPGLAVLGLAVPDAFHCTGEGCLFWVWAWLVAMAGEAVFALLYGLALLLFSRRLTDPMRRAFQIGLFTALLGSCFLLALWGRL